MNQKRANQGDMFLQAYDAYADALFRHCFFRVYSRPRAEELVQEAFMKAWEYIGKGNVVENMRAFLYRILNNLIIDESRKAKEMSLEVLLEESQAFEPTGEDSQTIERQMLLKQVISEIHRLPKDEREILIMRYVDDLDPKDIAEILGIEVNNASVRINRAMKSLKVTFH